MPLCDDHLSTALTVELSVRRLTPADDALHALLEVYGVEEPPRVLLAETSLGPAASRPPAASAA
jgi:hypothetical protein